MNHTDRILFAKKKKKKSLARVVILMGLCECWSYSTWLFGVFFVGEEGFECVYNTVLTYPDSFH